MPEQRRLPNVEPYQFHWFPNGGCVIHKLMCTDRTTLSVWLDAEGNLVDAELLSRSLRRTYAVNGEARRKSVEAAARRIFLYEKGKRDDEQRRGLEVGSQGGTARVSPPEA